jgi:sigma-B regulation protein RsbU (phosphoserine phosphatase)
MFYAILDANRSTLTYTQAGIPPGLLIRPGDRQITVLEAKSPLLGLFDGLQFAEETIRLAPGDKVLLYTDAVTEVARADGEMMGVANLRSFLEQRGDLGIEELVEQVYTYGQAFSGQVEYEDDFTAVGLELTRVPGEQSIEETE